MTDEVTLVIDVGDLNKLPIGWIDEVEDQCDASIADIFESLGDQKDGKKPKVRRGKALRAIGLLQLYKTNPDACWADTKHMVLDESSMGGKKPVPAAEALPPPPGE